MTNLRYPIVITSRRRLCQLDISYIISAAMESGVYGSRWLLAYDAVAVYGPVEDKDGKIHDREWVGFNITLPNGDNEQYAEGNEVPAVNTEITIARVVEALEKLASDPETYDVNKAFIFNYDDYDAPDADIVMQVAVFNKVIYG